MGSKQANPQLQHCFLWHIDRFKPLKQVRKLLQYYKAFNCIPHQELKDKLTYYYGSSITYWSPHVTLSSTHNAVVSDLLYIHLKIKIFLLFYT